MLVWHLGLVRQKVLMLVVLSMPETKHLILLSHRVRYSVTDPLNKLIVHRYSERLAEDWRNQFKRQRDDARCRLLALVLMRL